jgi:hypothetical protein
MVKGYPRTLLDLDKILDWAKSLPEDGGLAALIQLLRESHDNG